MNARKADVIQGLFLFFIDERVFKIIVNVKIIVAKLLVIAFFVVVCVLSDVEAYLENLIVLIGETREFIV